MKKLLIIGLSIFFSFCVLLTPHNTKAATATSKAGIVDISYGKLNVRSSSSTNSSIVTNLSKGSYVTLLSQSGSWWYVEYAKGKFGYCHSDYIDVVSSSTATVNISSGYLNVRSGAGSTYSKIGTLNNNERVIILSSSGVWRKILYNGTKIGYVSSVYLKLTSTTTN